MNPAFKDIFYCDKPSLDLNKLGDRNITITDLPLVGLVVTVAVFVFRVVKSED